MQASVLRTRCRKKSTRWTVCRLRMWRMQWFMFCPRRLMFKCMNLHCSVWDNNNVYIVPLNVTFWTNKNSNKFNKSCFFNANYSTKQSKLSWIFAKMDLAESLLRIRRTRPKDEWWCRGFERSDPLIERTKRHQRHLPVSNWPLLSLFVQCHQRSPL